MKNTLLTLATLCRRLWVWSLLLVLLLAALIWWLGPLLAVADRRFWAEVPSRLLSIAALCLLWGLFLVFHSWQTARRAQRAAGDAARRAQQEEDARVRNERGQLEERHKDALQVLRSTRLYAARSERWRAQLPWYLLLGAPGSGKTALLDYSGLEFPLNTQDSQRLTRDMRGTACAEWYFAEQAVLIDTAGRYLTQADATVDASGWAILLDLLRRRRSRPLNGVLVTLTVEELLDGGELKLETLARQTRQRLEELRRRLAVEVPVYLVLTKADRLTGFEAFFDQLSREESAQVLGATFTKAYDGTTDGVVRQEFEELLRRLNSQVIGRIHQERDTQRRGRILDFPHQLAQIGAPLCLFIELAFAGNRYQRASQLRGFYLTSAPHVESGLDPLTEEIGRHLPLDNGSLPVLRQGRARFIHDLLSRVIFGEAHLACLDGKERRRIVWGQRSVYAGALGVLLTVAGAWAVSFSHNQTRLLQVQDSAERRERARATLSTEADARQVLASLEQAYAATQLFASPEAAPYRERAGLYQGHAVNPALQRTYRHDLEQLLLPRVAHQLEGQIRANLGNRDQLLGSLRAYLMLQDTEHRDAQYLRDWLAADWSLRYPGDAESLQALSAHFARLLEAPSFAYALDERLVNEARQALHKESLAQVIYRELLAEARSLPAYRLDRQLGPEGAWLQNADALIPGFFTAEGYREFYLTRSRGAIEALLRDNWVLGRRAEVSAADLQQATAEMERLYFQDYAEHWSRLINGLDIAEMTQFDQLQGQLAGLGGADTPLLALLAELRRHTQLKDTVSGTATRMLEAAQDGGKPGVALTTADVSIATSASEARRALQHRFRELNELVDESGAPSAKLGKALQALEQMQQQLADLNRASDPPQAAFNLARARMSGERGAIELLQQHAAGMPHPLGDWMHTLAVTTWRSVLDETHRHLARRYRQELYAPYREALHGRYPFHAQSESDVALADFGDFFKAEGQVERFFSRYLQPFVARADSAYRVRTLDGQGLALSPRFLSQIERAQAIRQGFFSADAGEPQIQFSLEPYSLDPNLGRAQFSFAGMQHEYRHGPIAPVSFHWPAAAEHKTRLVLEELNGKRVGIERDSGPWALFRVFDLLQLAQHSGQDVLLVKANFGGRRVNYLLHTAHRRNPFDLAELRRFRLPAAL